MLEARAGLEQTEAQVTAAEATLLAVARDHRDILEVVRVALDLADGERYPHEGRIDFVANRVDPATGTLLLRAAIPNPDGLLRPGLYARIHAILPERRALLIPQAAVQSDQQGSYVLRHLDGRVERRNVRLGERTGVFVIAEEGLAAGDRVVVRGLQRVRSGQPATAVPLPPETQGGGDQSDRTRPATAPANPVAPRARGPRPCDS